MSFFAHEDGSIPEPTGRAEIGTGNFEPMPDGLIASAIIKDAKWDELPDSGARHINLTWQIGTPEAYKNRIVFQKLWVTDFDPNTYNEDNRYRSSETDLVKAKAKGQKARDTLAEIDYNCGGTLLKKGVEPKHGDLLTLLNKPMNITLRQWRMKNDATGEYREGNWVGEVNKWDEDEVKKQILPTQPKRLDPTERRREMKDDLPF